MWGVGLTRFGWPATTHNSCPSVRAVQGGEWVRRLVPALVLAWLVVGAVSAQAFTLISGRTTLSVTPTQAVRGAYFTFVGQYLFPSSCPTGAAPLVLIFNFYWDKTSSSPTIWTKTVSTCTVIPGYWYYDTGRSPRMLPPSGRDAVGQHTLEVDVINAATGGQMPNGTQTAYYIVLADPAPPPPTPIPAPKPTPPRCYAEGHTKACPSPSAVDCAHPPTAALPPGAARGGMAALLLGGVLAGGLPLGAAAMVLFPGIRPKRDRWVRLAALFGLGSLMLLTTTCAIPVPKAVASPSAAAASVTVGALEVTPDCRGYWMAGTNGRIYPFGNAAGFGSAGGTGQNKPIVDMEATPDGGGYWLVASDGGILPFGTAAGYGSNGNITLNKPIVAMENTPDGAGYWLVAADGGIFPFGDAVGYGSTGNVQLKKPIVDMEATPDGGGYWLVAADGGIFPFGDAVGYGSPGNVQLKKPIVGMEATSDGHGYWLVGSDGGIFPFGDAAGYGSTGSASLVSPIVGMEATPDGHGYWLIAADGGVFPFGDAPSLGSPAGHL